MTLLLFAVGALSLGLLLAVVGFGWIGQGGSYWSDGRRRSNVGSGCATVVLGGLALMTGAVMAREVELWLWPLAIAMVAPLLASYPLLREVAFRGVAPLLDDIEQRLRDSPSPTAIEVQVSSRAHAVIRAALSVEPAASEPVTAGYRQADGDRMAAYRADVEARTRAIVRRGGLRLAGLTALLLTAPAITLYFWLRAPQLELLGYQVLAGCCVVALLGLALVGTITRQMRQADRRIRQLLAAI